MRWLPGIHERRHDEIAWLPQDVFAGLVLTAALVPVGIAYVVASGVPAICGLYATVLGRLAYALFGPSRVLVLGPDSSLVAIVLGVVVPLSAGDPRRAIVLAGMMALVSGALPQGLPAFVFPLIASSDIVPVLLGGTAVALVSFAGTSVLSRNCAARAGGLVDVDQEMVGLGAANLAAGLFQGIPISASASRTPVAQAAGARTQLAGVDGAIAVALLLMFAPTLLANLPRATLAAVVMGSALSLIVITDLAVYQAFKGVTPGINALGLKEGCR